MRKTIYDSYVKTFITCEERCALKRVITDIQKYIDNYLPSEDRYPKVTVTVSRKDIEVLNTLASFTCDDPPADTCVSTPTLRSRTHVKQIKDTE